MDKTRTFPDETTITDIRAACGLGLFGQELTGKPDSFRQAQPKAAPHPERVARYWLGHWAEWCAVLHLILRGYRILARRYRSPFGEIDIIARRGRRLAFVEVKRRPPMAEAEGSLTPMQAERIGRAAEHWIRRRRRYRDHEMGMDLILVSPGRWPW